MEYVEFKKEVRRYRQVYTCLYSYVCTLLMDTVRAYAGYNTLVYKCVEEWKQIRQYGFFIYHFAELQNLTALTITNPEDNENIEWEMTENAISIVRAYQTGKLDDNELLRLTAQWCRTWYPFFATQKHFKDGMSDFVRHSKEITQTKEQIV